MKLKLKFRCVGCHKIDEVEPQGNEPPLCSSCFSPMVLVKAQSG